MTDQPDLFSVVAARDDGIARGDTHAHPRWKVRAYCAVVWCAENLDVFTADQVWERLEADGVDVSTHNPSALGPVFLAVAREGLIVKTGRMPLTRNPRRHRNLVEWRGTRALV
jgi:hypothetical protein